MNNEQKTFMDKLSKCSLQDLEDIHSLFIASLALIKLAKHNKNTAIFSSVLSHTTAILSGLFGINYGLHNDNKIFLLIWYIPVMLYFAQRGFDADKATNVYKTELKDAITQHQKLSTVLEKSTPVQIHNIATQYRSEIPKEHELDYMTTENINRAIHYILMRHYR